MEMLYQVRKLARIGATDLEIADFLSVSNVTFIMWKAEYPKFLNALDAVKKASNDRVKRSLYHRAVGYTCESEKVAINSNGKFTRTKIREHVPLIEAAAIYWHSDRDPQVETHTDSGSAVTFSLALLIRESRLIEIDSPVTIAGRLIERPKT